ncbi:hypothetical protein RB213_002952 [Colletotrichum asianum]
MKITSVIQVLLAVALAICVKAARAQSKGGALWPPIEASTDSEVDSKIDQRSGESGNQKRWRFKYVERNVPGARFYYPSIKKRQNLNSDMDAEVKDSWKISQRPEAQQIQLVRRLIQMRRLAASAAAVVAVVVVGG